MHVEDEREWNSEMNIEAKIERVWGCIGRCIWRPRSSNSEMHLEAVIELNSEMDLVAEIERVWRCI
jgi:L-serine deaminase